MDTPTPINRIFNPDDSFLVSDMNTMDLYSGTLRSTDALEISDTMTSSGSEFSIHLAPPKVLPSYTSPFALILDSARVINLLPSAKKRKEQSSMPNAHDSKKVTSSLTSFGTRILDFSLHLSTLSNNHVDIKKILAATPKQSLILSQNAQEKLCKSVPAMMSAIAQVSQCMDGLDIMGKVIHDETQEYIDTMERIICANDDIKQRFKTRLVSIPNS